MHIKAVATSEAEQSFNLVMQFATDEERKRIKHDRFLAEEEALYILSRSISNDLPFDYPTPMGSGLHGFILHEGKVYEYFPEFDDDDETDLTKSPIFGGAK